MNFTRCIPISNISALTHQHSTTSDNEDLTQNMNNVNFFEKQNYQLILQCLNGGYGVGTDIIKYMEDYGDLIQRLINTHNAYSTNNKSKIRQQSTLSSYHTTKRAQIQTICSSDSLVQLLQTRHKAIEDAIKSYQRKIDKMYPKVSVIFTRKHYQSDRMKRLFDDEYSDLSKVENKLQSLLKDQTKIQQVIRQIEGDIHNLIDKKPINQTKISKANARLTRKQRKLETIQTNIIQAKNNYHQAQETYRQNVTNIYHQCRILEEERLNDIRQVLLEFIQAIHSLEYSQQQDQMYQNLITTIKLDQDTNADLDFWARTYGILPPNQPADNQNNLITTTDNINTSNVVDDQVDVTHSEQI